MDEEKGLPTGSGNNPQQPASNTRKGLLSPRMLSFRSSSVPLMSPTEMLTRHHKENHDSLRPPLLHPTSVIPEKHPNEGFKPEGFIPAVDKLGNYRRLVGIDSTESHTVGGSYNRPAENIGIYTHIIRQEVRSLAQYKRFSLLINSALGFQIFVAACLTALGAGGGPRAAVTVFGAINTVLASILAFLKGSGLPNREKYYANEWAKLREYIEQREREFGREACVLDVDMEVRKIETMYNEVKQDVEANTPDGYTSVTQAKKLASVPNANNQTNQPAPSHLDEKTETTSSFQSRNGPMPIVSAPNPQSTTPGLGSGIGLPTGPPEIAQPAPAHVHPQHPSFLGKLADRLSGTTANGGATAHHVLDTVSRLSSKLGADGMLDRLHHLEAAHDRVNRGFDDASGALGAEAEKLTAAGREATSAGERAIRGTAGAVGERVRQGADALRSVGRDVEARGELLVDEAGRQAEGVRTGAMSAGSRVEGEAEGYFGSFRGHLEGQAARLRDAGGRAQEGAGRIVREAERGVEGVEREVEGDIGEGRYGDQGWRGHT